MDDVACNTCQALPGGGAGAGAGPINTQLGDASVVEVGTGGLLLLLKSRTGGRALHSFPFPLNLSLPCPFPLDFSLLCPLHNPN